MRGELTIDIEPWTCLRVSILWFLIMAKNVGLEVSKDASVALSGVRFSDLEERICMWRVSGMKRLKTMARTVIAFPNIIGSQGVISIRADANVGPVSSPNKLEHEAKKNTFALVHN